MGLFINHNYDILLIKVSTALGEAVLFLPACYFVQRSISKIIARFCFLYTIRNSRMINIYIIYKTVNEIKTVKFASFATLALSLYNEPTDFYAGCGHSARCIGLISWKQEEEKTGGYFSSSRNFFRFLTIEFRWQKTNTRMLFRNIPTYTYIYIHIYKI